MHCLFFPRAYDLCLMFMQFLKNKVESLNLVSPFSWNIVVYISGNNGKSHYHQLCWTTVRFAIVDKPTRPIALVQPEIVMQFASGVAFGPTDCQLGLLFKMATAYRKLMWAGKCSPHISYRCSFLLPLVPRFWLPLSRPTQALFPAHPWQFPDLAHRKLISNVNHMASLTLSKVLPKKITLFATSILSDSPFPRFCKKWLRKRYFGQNIFLRFRKIPPIRRCFREGPLRRRKAPDRLSSQLAAAVRLAFAFFSHSPESLETSNQIQITKAA